MALFRPLSSRLAIQFLRRGCATNKAVGIEESKEEKAEKLSEEDEEEPYYCTIYDKFYGTKARCHGIDERRLVYEDRGMRYAFRKLVQLIILCPLVLYFLTTDNFGTIKTK